MKLSKKDFKLIGAFVDKGNPKEELNFALLRDGGFVATDTRRVISFNLQGLQCEPILTHKRVLNLVEKLMSKDDFVKISSVGTVDVGFISMSLSNANLDVFEKGEFKFPEMGNVLDKKLDHHFKLDSLKDIVFELSQKNCFIESAYLYPLMEHDDADWYEVFYNVQDGETSGMVKIIAMRVIDDVEQRLYTAVVMGRVFISEAKGE